VGDELVAEVSEHGAHLRLFGVLDADRGGELARDLAAHQGVDRLLGDLVGVRHLSGVLVDDDAERDRANLLEPEDDDGARDVVDLLAEALVVRRVDDAKELGGERVVLEDGVAELLGRSAARELGFSADLRHVGHERGEVPFALHALEQARERRLLAFGQGRRAVVGRSGGGLRGGRLRPLRLHGRGERNRERGRRFRRRRRRDGHRRGRRFDLRRSRRRHLRYENARRHRDGSFARRTLRLEELAQELAGGRRAIPWRLGETTLDGDGDGRRHLGHQIADGHDRIAHVHHHDHHRVRMRENRPAREHLVEDGAERIEIGLGSDLVVRAEHLFGRHVARRPQDLARLRARRPLARNDGLGDAEVEKLDAKGRASQHEDVGRLEIAVDDSAPVREIERRRHLREVLADFLDRKPPFLLHRAREIGPLQALHHVVRALVELAEVEDVDDVRMLEAGCRARLAEEARRHVGRAREGAAQEFHRDLLAERRVLGLEHGAHAPLPEQAADDEIPHTLAHELGQVFRQRRIPLRAFDLELVQGPPLFIMLREVRREVEGESAKTP
jgi:hypothetical protein